VVRIKTPNITIDIPKANIPDPAIKNPASNNTTPITPIIIIIKEEEEDNFIPLVFEYGINSIFVDLHLGHSYSSRSFKDSE